MRVRGEEHEQTPPQPSPFHHEQYIKYKNERQKNEH